MNHSRVDLECHVDTLTTCDRSEPQRIVARQVDLPDLQKERWKAFEVCVDRRDEWVA